MRPYGGFSHNDQTLRILTRLERRYAEFDGLNLTWETLEGTVKHNGPLLGPPRRAAAAVDRRIRPAPSRSSWTPIPGPRRRSRRSPTTSPTTTTTSTTGCAPGCSRSPISPTCRWSGPVFARGRRGAIPASTSARLIHEAIRRVIDRMVRDLIGETGARLAGERRRRAPTTVRALGAPVAAFSDEMRSHDRALKRFLFERMYRHYRVNRMSSKARRVVRELFQLFLAEPECLPGEWRACRPAASEAERARIVADYLAGMTDRFALDEHRRLFDTYAPV